MAEPAGSVADMGDNGQNERGSGRSRVLMALLVLLLLLLAVIATVADVFLTHTPAQRTFISRNLGCLQCHTELIPDTAKASVHNPFLLKDCTVCHTAHGQEVVERQTSGAMQTWQRLKTLVEWMPLRLACRTYTTSATLVSVTTSEGVTTTVSRVKGQTSYLTMPESQLCWTCHGDLGPLRTMTYQHAPFQNGYCTNCHDPHASDNATLLKQPEVDLCKECHPMGAELSRAQVHPPAAGWHCTNCHNPHASNYQGMLVLKQRDLCFTCHPQVAPLSKKAVQHNPFMNDDCTGCHEPHGSNTPPLLVSAQPDLCYRCHPTIAQDFKLPSHHPVGTVRLNCADCHNPHAADYEFLLTAKDNNFCYQCHGDKQALYNASAHDVNLCIRCHTPHGSDFAPMLRNSNPELCLECHAGQVTGSNKHPVQRAFYDVHSKSALTCTSTCHNPHGTQYPRMLNYPYQRDAICLGCHPKVGVEF